MTRLRFVFGAAYSRHLAAGKVLGDAVLRECITHAGEPLEATLRRVLREELRNAAK
jgi:hypothetical protein